MYDFDEVLLVVDEEGGMAVVEFVGQDACRPEIDFLIVVFSLE
jgi:hypothetical protein